MNSCVKGKRGERAWRDQLITHGYRARRGQQFSGTPDSADVISPDLPGLYFEVKTVEHLNLAKAMAQAVGDAGGKIPVVAHKRNRGEWLVTMRASDFFKLLPGTETTRAAVTKLDANQICSEPHDGEKAPTKQPACVSLAQAPS